MVLQNLPDFGRMVKIVWFAVCIWLMGAVLTVEYRNPATYGNHSDLQSRHQ